jgi:chromosome partitioning protein
MTTIISLINQKGGVGKTTCAINIGAGLSQLDKRVLLVDLDAQAHLTYGLGIPAHDLTQSVYNLLRGEIDLKQLAIRRNGMHVIPSSIDLSGADIELSGVAGREFLLKEALSKAVDYDYVLIDCPPNLGLLTLNALTTSNEVYIPVQTEFLALQGMSKLIQTTDVVKKRLNELLNVTGVIATRYDNRKNLNREVVERIRGYFGDRVFGTLIRDNVALAEAPSFGQTIFEYAPKSYGAEDYERLCQEIVDRKKDG